MFEPKKTNYHDDNSNISIDNNTINIIDDDNNIIINIDDDNYKNVV